VPVELNHAASHILECLDQGVEDEVYMDVSEGEEDVPPEIAEAARNVQYGRCDKGPRRWKARHYSAITRAALALKNQFGLLDDNEANRLMGSKWVRKWMAERGMRPSHIVSSYLAAVETWLTATSDEQAGLQMRHVKIMRKRKKKAIEKWAPLSILSPSSWGSMLSGRESFGDAFSVYSAPDSR
jgi:hypothetical protein